MFLSRAVKLILLAGTVPSFSDAFIGSSKNRAFMLGGDIFITTPQTATAPHHQQKQKPYSYSSSSKLFMDGILEDFVSTRDENARQKVNKEYLGRLQTRVERINGLEEATEELGDEELQAKTKEFKDRLAKGEDINGPLLEEAFAVVREASWRVLELRHYDVQMVGGLILHEGRLAEMATGEGKTLVSTLPVYANALTGTASFVITVNDYLAKRDMEKMGQVHRFLGLTVGLIQSGMTEPERRKAYDNDVVYVTNSELGFDYLRDHLALTPENTVLPNGAGEFDGFCVVDEADSVLIDEARTPLIISKQVPASATKYETSKTLADALKPDVHYKIDLKNKACSLTEVGYRDAENALGIKSLFEIQDKEAWAPYIVNAVNAKELFKKDVEYSVMTNEKGEKTGVGIIDSFTGRVLDGRRWSDGLHQSIEVREGIQVSEQSQVIAKVTYQALFRQFTRLSGMTGTALTDADELDKTYNLNVVPVPTALPIARRDYPDVSFRTRDAADMALVKEVINVGGGQDGGRPCLIGTTSVSQSELIVAKLAEEGIKAELLNASPKNAPRESELVAQAGRTGVVTVATNMAGRGTDILLGGCSRTMARLKARSYLVADGVVSKEEATKLPPSPEEDYYPCPLNEDLTLLLKETSVAVKKALGTDLTAIELDEALTISTDTTEAEDDPAHVVKLRDTVEAIREAFSEVTDAEKVTVQEMGGLYVMGTNRHESSRIDNQLRGRAGRQGDPGTSRFFLSFEDDMFVVFGGDQVQNILKMFRVSDDMPVEAPQVTESLDRVQEAVEEKYRDLRKEIFKFDEVLNGQRRVIYKRRRDLLAASDEESFKIMQEYNTETLADIVQAQVDGTTGKVNVEKVLERTTQFFPPVGAVVRSSDIEGQDATGVTQFLAVAIEETFNAKAAALDEQAKAAGKEPFSLGRSARYIALVTMDNAWSDHLQSMDNLKEAVVMRSFQGRDPLQEYEADSFGLFESLENTMRANAVFSLWQSV